MTTALKAWNVQPLQPSPTSVMEFVTDAVVPAGGTDNIFRVIGSTTATRVFTCATADLRSRFGSSFDRLHTDIRLLLDVVGWQRHKLEYQAVYTAYLLGALSEEEFMQEADNFMVESKSLPLETVAEQLFDLNRLLATSITAADSAEFLGVDVEQVVEAQELIAHNGWPQHLAKHR